jgi:hypothetical protein
LIVALALPFVWCADANAFHAPPAIAVHLRIATIDRTGAVAVRTYVLTCDPTGGTLPMASRVCMVIREYPQAMLDPPPGVETCTDAPNRPEVGVVAVFDGQTTYFGGTPGCHRPGGTAEDIYWLATRGKLLTLALAAESLHATTR